MTGTATTVTQAPTDSCCSNPGLPPGHSAHRRCDRGRPRHARRRTVVRAAGCLETCQLWSANPLTGQTRKPTSFRTRTSPLNGYDGISFAPLTETTIVYGRGHSVVAQQLASSTGRPIKTFGCPRARCGLTEVSSIVPSPDGAWVIVDVYDHGCEYCEAGSPKPISQRFALRIDDRGVTRLPVVPFDDIYFD